MKYCTLSIKGKQINDISSTLSKRFIMSNRLTELWRCLYKTGVLLQVSPLWNFLFPWRVCECNRLYSAFVVRLFLVCVSRLDVVAAPAAPRLLRGHNIFIQSLFWFPLRLLFMVPDPTGFYNCSDLLGKYIFSSYCSSWFYLCSLGMCRGFSFSHGCCSSCITL